MATRISDTVVANCGKSPERMAWLEGLPSVVQELRQRWELTPDAPLNGEEPSCSYVLAVHRADGAPAVLNVCDCGHSARAAAEPREDWSNCEWMDLARTLAP